MAFKMKGPTFFNSPLKQVKTSGFGPRASKGNDDQSKELAKSKYEMGEYSVDPTNPNVDVAWKPAYEGGDYSKEDLRKMTPKQRKKIEKGQE